MTTDATMIKNLRAELRAAGQEFAGRLADLAGTGADMPTGLSVIDHATDRIIESNTVGALVDCRPFVRAMGLVKGAQHEPSSILMPVELWTELNCLQDVDLNLLQAPKAYEQLTEYVSSFLPTDGGIGTDEITAIVGDLEGKL